MASDWSELTLEESMDAIIDYRGKTPKKTDSGIPLITAKIIKSGRIETVNEFISEDDYDTWMRRGIPNEGDVVMTTEAPLGEIAQLDGRKIALAQRVITLRGKKDILDNTFLKYLMISEYVQHQLDGRGTGTTVKGIKQSELRKVILKFPPFTEQKAIAHILGSLDDKIELNRQMNETLEAMAQALFKSWFVDFDPVIDNALAASNTIPDELLARAEQRKTIEKKDNSDIQDLFPNEFEFSEEMGWIPKGWAVKRIKDIGKVVTGKTPPKKIDNAYSENGIPFITPTDIDDLPFVIYTNRYLSEDGVQAVKNSRISAGSICVTCIGSQMGKTTIAPLASVSNQQINSITGCNQFWRNYLFFNLRRRRDEIFLLGSSGSTMPILNKSNFEAFPILCPSEKLLSSLDSNFQSTIDSILENTKQSYTLTKLRDTLLPKLMSGELRIPDAAELVDEAV